MSERAFATSLSLNARGHRNRVPSGSRPVDGPGCRLVRLDGVPVPAMKVHAVKVFAVYTLARIGLLAAAYGLIWLVFGHWLAWNALSALYTAIIAMVISSLVAFATLKSLRADLAASVEQRAARAKAAFDAKRSGEDD